MMAQASWEGAVCPPPVERPHMRGIGPVIGPLAPGVAVPARRMFRRQRRAPTAHTGQDRRSRRPGRPTTAVVQSGHAAHAETISKTMRPRYEGKRIRNPSPLWSAPVTLAERVRTGNLVRIQGRTLASDAAGWCRATASSAAMGSFSVDSGYGRFITCALRGIAYGGQGRHGEGSARGSPLSPAVDLVGRERKRRLSAG